MSRVTNLERTNLEAHVDLCAERYENMEKRLNNLDDKFEKLESRLDGIDTKIDAIKDTLAQGQVMMVKAMIGVGGTVIVAVISAVAVYLGQ